MQCNAIFISDADYQQHLLMHHKRMRGSTSSDSSSEVLLGSDVEDTHTNCTDVSPTKKAGIQSTSGQPQDNSTGDGSLLQDTPNSAYPDHFSGFGSNVPGSGAQDILLLPHEDSEDDDEEIVNYSEGEMARLLSLNEHDMVDNGDDSSGEDSNEEQNKPGMGRVAVAHDSKSTLDAPSAVQGGVKSSPSSATAKPARMEPVGVFWDIENCSVPMSKSAFAVAAKLRQEFIAGKREAEFMCVCDIQKERKEVTDDLNKAQVRRGERGEE